ncbi:AcrR family transcriptional regulator [Actinoplanes lutulentus]|uniref:TetR family transcriptional regulator n=1 Tax=Actinoplanes lutulentus TaxID=1287878 RepID=A0A327Z1U6_9ACTN|nr:TetR/AcrR family transcriptional regulator [Actinoplanes lutulentus]MBB2943357.1 AcrR family transcriptional regulator [Actinoplanes lutulentus]RAK28415.1 TetR family transcriptional regulator [Actinoplanes lutulentus]
MSQATITHGVFFSPQGRDLPRGRHALQPAAVQAAHRERIMAAFAELVAEHGLTSVTVADVVKRAAVSRTAFYGLFGDLPSCADAAYQRFIEVLLDRVSAAATASHDWPALIPSVIDAYLDTVAADLVVTRAMMLEMDSAGRSARDRRRQALAVIAQFLHDRHTFWIAKDDTLGPLPAEAFLGFVYTLRQLACDLLDEHAEPDLRALREPMIRWVSASVLGAASA